MPFTRIDNTKDVINGAAVVSTGAAKPKLYDNQQRTQHLPDTSGGEFTNIGGRYLHHGGDGGSGNWEH